MKTKYMLIDITIIAAVGLFSGCAMSSVGCEPIITEGKSRPAPAAFGHASRSRA